MQITSPSSLRFGWAVYSGATPIAYIFNCFFVFFMFWVLMRDSQITCTQGEYTDTYQNMFQNIK